MNISFDKSRNTVFFQLQVIFIGEKTKKKNSHFCFFTLQSNYSHTIYHVYISLWSNGYARYSFVFNSIIVLEYRKQRVPIGWLIWSTREVGWRHKELKKKKTEIYVNMTRYRGVNRGQTIYYKYVFTVRVVAVLWERKKYYTKRHLCTKLGWNTP